MTEAIYEKMLSPDILLILVCSGVLGTVISSTAFVIVGYMLVNEIRTMRESMQDTMQNILVKLHDEVSERD